ncbi:caspase family protein [Pseudomonas fluorescens]|uniref:Peptidase C14 caspase domain-containing protein n=1 Tax=Pseudomonas fluorescens TaxID=294 RepID=A0A5E7VLS0_PSEFL|nr:caspase family protein [Pseudomonas fluorescens]VVQ23663.1 hypothetical protein PS928_05581 [Pseudomonas fluorescens]
MKIFTRWFSTFVIFLFIQVNSHFALAGNIEIERNSVRFFNENRDIWSYGQTQKPTIVNSSHVGTINIEFHANDYVYGSEEYAYALLVFLPKVEIKQGRISLNELPSGTDIYAVQMSSPNDLKTLDEAAAPYSIKIPKPDEQGTYRLYLSGIPIFLKNALDGDPGHKVAFKIDSKKINNMQHIERLESISTIQIDNASNVSAEVNPLRLYLKVNGQYPSKVKVASGLNQKPLVFSWSLYVDKELQNSSPQKPNKKEKVPEENALFRYRLIPDEEWSSWTEMNEVTYAFILRGAHQFQVQAKRRAGTQMTSPTSQYQFNLENEYISKKPPVVSTKSPVGVPELIKSPVAFKELYPESKALLIGIAQFDDKMNFAQLESEKIQADITRMQDALEINGFTVTTLNGARVTRDEIIENLSNIFGSAGQNDRIFVYFSSHGFADPMDASQGYIATTDCDMNKPKLHCLSLGELKGYSDTALSGRQVRQVLFAVDSCFSGLGVVSKSAGVPDLTRLAEPQGAYMITAGMANQKAQIDPGLKMSTFTYYLAEGLTGKADILNNMGLITLGQLYVYVQYKVAEQTSAKQIPMMGRLSGEGEMLFLPLKGK